MRDVKEATIRDMSKRGKYDCHGMSSSIEYTAWKNMKARCLGYQSKQNKDYKDRGIAFCDSWRSFSLFFEDMGRCPEGYTLDRIDNDKGYSKDNCRWATRSQQQRNQRELRSTNKSGFKGVCFDNRRKKWLAFYYGKIYGSFNDKNKAIEKRKSLEVSNG